MWRDGRTTVLVCVAIWHVVELAEVDPIDLEMYRYLKLPQSVQSGLRKPTQIPCDMFPKKSEFVGHLIQSSWT